MPTFDMSGLPSVTNPLYYPLYWEYERSRFLILKGGSGSGKSQFVATHYINKVVEFMDKGHRVGVLALRKQSVHARASVFRLFQRLFDEWGWSGIIDTNKTEMKFTFPNGAFIQCGGLDDPERIKSIEGITDIWLEEANQFTYDDFKEANRRLRAYNPVPYQIIMSFNPVGSFWVRGRFFDKGGLEPVPGDRPADRIKRGRNVTALTTTYLDNAWSTPEDARELKELADHDLNQYRVYALGEWGSVEHVILTNWRVDEFSYRDFDFDQISSGLDFGFNHPSACVRLGMKDNILYVRGEPVYQSGLTNPELIDRLKAYPFGPRETIYADSAEPGRILEMKSRGLRVEGAKKGPNSVNDCIDWWKAHQIIIHPRCVGFLNEVKFWQWRVTRDGRVLDEPVDRMDDAIAAGRYGSEPFRLNNYRPKPAYQGVSRRQGRGAY